MLGRIVSALSVAAIAGGVVYAQAAEEAGPSREDLAKAHAPAAIATRAEARAYAEWEFFFADADMDDKLSEQEFAAFASEHSNAQSDDSYKHLNERFVEISGNQETISKQFFIR